jgi:hypothetical protein
MPKLTFLLMRRWNAGLGGGSIDSKPIVAIDDQLASVRSKMLKNYSDCQVVFA